MGVGTLYESTEALIDIRRGLAEANYINRSVDPYNLFPQLS
jgi:hypothetical protein